MKVKFKYKGRTFTSAQSLANAMNSDLRRDAESNIRRAAQASGLAVRKSGEGLQVTGDAEQMKRFNNRLGR